SAVAIGAGEYHFAVAPGLSFTVSGEKQPYAGSAGCVLTSFDAVHRMAGNEDDGISVRRAGDGWTRAWRSVGRGGFLQPGRGAQSAAEQGAVRSAVDVAPGDSPG